jgi:hypothetical protein
VTVNYLRQRALWADIVNYHYERAGIDAAVDPRGFYRKAYQEELEVGHTRLGPDVTDREVKNALAKDYWAKRKQHLGLTANLSHAQALERIAAQSRMPSREQQLQAHITAWTEKMAYAASIGDSTLYYERERQQAEAELAALRSGRLSPPTREELQAQATVLTQQLQQTERERTETQRAYMLESAREAQGKPRSARETERLVAMGIDLSDEAPQRGARFRFKERDRGRGHGW